MKCESSIQLLSLRGSRCITREQIQCYRKFRYQESHILTSAGLQLGYIALRLLLF